MASLLSIDIIGERNLLRNLDQMPDIVRAILVEKMTKVTELIRDQVTENIEDRLSKTVNTKPKEYSGSPKHMADSVESDVSSNGLSVEARVYISGIPYAKAQEEGATTPPHMIFPRKAKVLAFMAASGDKVFARHVFHPGGQIPATWFMRDAYRQYGPQISRDIKSAVVQGIRAKMRAR